MRFPSGLKPNNLLLLAAALAALLLSGSIAGAAAKMSKSDEEAEGLFASTCGFCHSDGGALA